MTGDSSKNANFEVDTTISKDENGNTLANGFSRDLLMRIDRKEFNFYEFVAGPRIIKDYNKLQFNSSQVLRAINEIFSCSCCMDIFNDPVNIKNCLHKFCKRCIEPYIRTM